MVTPTSNAPSPSVLLTNMWPFYLQIISAINFSPSQSFIISPEQLPLLLNWHLWKPPISPSDQSPLGAVRVIFSYKSDLRFWVWHCCNIVYLLHSCTFFFVCRRARAGTKKVLLLVLCFLSKSKRWIMAFFYQADPDRMLFIPRFMSNTPQMLVCYYAWGWKNSLQHKTIFIQPSK